MESIRGWRCGQGNLSLKIFQAVVLVGGGGELGMAGKITAHTWHTTTALKYQCTCHSYATEYAHSFISQLVIREVSC